MMFTGIVTDVGRLLRIENGAEGRRLRIATAYAADSIELGASIACEGICLTVTAKGSDDGSNWFEVFAGRETLAVTRMGEWREGRRINLERSLRIGDELGGHLVSGHIDGLAHLVEKTSFGDQLSLKFEVPPELSKFIARKGSVALNGTSLTVNEVEGDNFTVHLIPHTVAVTTWADYGVGDAVNIEVDQMARYAARLAEKGGSAKPPDTKD